MCTYTQCNVLHGVTTLVVRKCALYYLMSPQGLVKYMYLTQRSSVYLHISHLTCAFWHKCIYTHTLGVFMLVYETKLCLWAQKVTPTPPPFLLLLAKTLSLPCSVSISLFLSYTHTHSHPVFCNGGGCP